VFGSNLLVDAATSIAKAFGVSDLVIGLTIVAAGTSLPEVATSITAAIRGQRDIAVGNVIGSNTFNVFGGLGISGVTSITGLEVAPSVLSFDIWFMIAVCFATLPIFIPGGQITRFAGGLFFFYYIVYTLFLVLGATGSDALPLFTDIMTSVIGPLTIMVLVFMVIRPKRPTLHT
ncbi:MAG TPA: sodium:calcium antiporter, partial [Myxococcota bacterium]|nr:sodium:calcium antiporter [Myxococcota bacterium]